MHVQVIDTNKGPLQGSCKVNAFLSVISSLSGSRHPEHRVKEISHSDITNSGWVGVHLDGRRSLPLCKYPF